MAGDWIKMRTDLYRDPKVSVMADHLMDDDGDLASYIDQNLQRRMTVTRNVMRNVTVGALVSVWGVMRQRGKRRDDDMVCDGVTIAVLDDISDLPGFGAAMAAAGWVLETEAGIEFPRFFSDYNVDPDEKAKAANAKRQQRFRERQKDAEASSCDATNNVTHNVTVTHREEKSREEKEAKASSAPKAVAFDATTGHFQVPDLLMRQWRGAYPALSLDVELSRASAWLIANPKNQKSNYARFLTNWLTRAQDKAPRVGGGTTPVQSAFAGAI